jgi:phenylalanyl-tRNA synthetase beta chain
MGMRSINNLVDISNLVMLETNQPLHFFDYDRLAGKGVHVRRAKTGETIETLDGQIRTLTDEMTLVADDEGGVAIAGVMGGSRTEVTPETTRILIEAASWDGVRTRRTTQALGLRSEASMRFEKEVDGTSIIRVLDRAVQLIEALGAGTGVEGHLNVCSKDEKLPQTRVRLDKINFVLGTCLDHDTVEKIWKALRIRIVEDFGDSWILESPSWRKDLVIEEDYIEETVRLYGYDKLDATMPAGGTTQGSRTPQHNLRRTLTALMIGMGYREAVNYSFINPAHLDRLNVPENHLWRRAVVIKNPLSEDQGHQCGHR